MLGGHYTVMQSSGSLNAFAIAGGGRSQSSKELNWCSAAYRGFEFMEGEVKLSRCFFRRCIITFFQAFGWEIVAAVEQPDIQSSLTVREKMTVLDASMCICTALECISLPDIQCDGRTSKGVPAVLVSTKLP